MATFALPPSSRATGDRIPPAHPATEGAWLFGPYRLEPATRRLWAGERVRELDARALAVLECLLRRADCVVPRATVIAEAWPGTATVFDSAVSKVIRRLRVALGDNPGHVLQTIYGEGYRLALPAELVLPTQLPLPGRPGEHSGGEGGVPANGAVAGGTRVEGNGGSAPEAGFGPVAGSASDRASAPASSTASSASLASSASASPQTGRPRWPWLAWLPWIIATLATLVAAILAWMLLRPVGVA